MAAIYSDAGMPLMGAATTHSEAFATKAAIKTADRTNDTPSTSIVANNKQTFSAQVVSKAIEYHNYGYESYSNILSANDHNFQQSVANTVHSARGGVVDVQA